MMLHRFARPTFCHLCLLLLASTDALACSGRLHIEVQNSAVYTLDYGAIVATQPQMKDCPGSDLVLFNHGKEVPIRISQTSDGRFGPGSRIVWVGQALHGPQGWYDPYSTVNVYILAAAPGAHARMRDLPAPAATAAKSATLHRRLHFEQENLMLRLNGSEMKPGDEPDVWQWAKLTPIDPQPFAFAFDLPDANLRAGKDSTVALTLNFRGVSNVIATKGQTKPADHRVEVSINGKLLQTLEWDGRSEFRKTLSLPTALLKDKANALSLRVPRRDAPDDPNNFIVDVVMFNWMEIAYPIHGEVAASAAAFTATPELPIELNDAAGTPELYAADGSYRALTAIGKSRYLAAGVADNVDLYTVAAGHASTPALVRAVTDRDLRAADPGYDYLIVAHPSLLDAIQPLAKYHREHGHRVEVVNVDAVYDQFNHGIAHPRAIRDLVAWGTQHWKIKPRYLLLVGDASTDIHHDVRNGALNGFSYSLSTEPQPSQVLSGPGFQEMLSYAYPQSENRVPNRNLIPTWQFPSTEGQSASDNDFVTMKPGDFHPTLAVGRFPVVSPDEVKAIVDKTIAYLSNPEPGSWRRDVTFISTSEVASFKQESDKIAASLDRQGFATNNVYTDFNDKDKAHYEQARTTLRNDLDAGNLLVHFLGHGGSYIWRVGPMGDLFSLDDVSKLTNAGRYPMVLAMTCFSAPFDNPSDDSIGERFLREANRGAIAVFAASWKNSPNPEYSKDLITQLLKPGNAIGDAIVAAKARIADQDFVEMYNLLGDPALVLARPRGELHFMRTRDRWNPQVLVRIPESDFGGDVYVNWIDAQNRILSTQHYQARNNRFALTPVDKAVTLSAYVVDGRNGYTAAGGVSLLDPPKPVAPPKPKTVVTAPSRPRISNPPRDAHDTIASMDFEEPAAKPLPPAGSP